MCCSVFFKFGFGSDACAILLRVWWIPLPETPPGHVCIPRHSRPARDLNHGRSCRNFCNTFVVSGLAAGFRLVVRFRCSPFPLHLNQGRCLMKPYNGKCFNVLRWISWVLFRFRCLNFCVYPAALCVLNMLWRFGRAIHVARPYSICRYPDCLEASAAARKHAMATVYSKLSVQFEKV